MVARRLRRNTLTTSTTSDDRDQQRQLDLAQRGADRVGAVGGDLERRLSAGSCARSSGSSARTPSTVSITLAPGWRVTSTITAGLPLKRPSVRVFSTPSLDLGDVVEAAPPAPLRQATTIGA